MGGGEKCWRSVRRRSGGALHLIYLQIHSGKGDGTKGRGKSAVCDNLGAREKEPLFLPLPLTCLKETEGREGVNCKKEEGKGQVRKHNSETRGPCTILIFKKRFLEFPSLC